MYFNWFTTAFIMYGLALSWENLTGGLFLNFLIGTILDFPAKTLAMILVLKCGRKYPYMVCQGITGKLVVPPPPTPPPPKAPSSPRSTPAFFLSFL
jgi:hypothetical protein